MVDNTRIAGIVVLVMTGVIAFLPQRVVARTRPSLPPKSLLTKLEKEDRDCVVNNGGLKKNVRVDSIELRWKGEQMLVRGSGACLCGAQNCGFWIYQRKGNKTDL